MKLKVLKCECSVQCLAGFHIHTYGDLTDGCSSACAHFNPDNTEHGGLDCKIRHLGDLGNILSEKGVSKGRLSTDTLSLDMGKRNCIIGRMIIVHADPDDLGKGGLNQEGEVIDEAVHEESLKTGNAGKRVACGVIGLAKGEVKCADGSKGVLPALIGAGIGGLIGYKFS